MKPSIQFSIASGIALCALATTSPTKAQIVPDATLPNNSNVTPVGNTSIITGGTRAGGNLFHSFDEFSVPTGSAAYFNNALDIQNIISRVTGGSVSNIDGLLRANGTANLFLLNPNGIVFGQGARLSIGGSFLASTASAINFADRTQFSATAHPTKPLLTVSVPIGLQFGEPVGRIRVQGPGHNLSVDPNNGAFLQGENPAGLAVQPGKTLALVGGDVTLEGGNLIAERGQIQVGSVAAPSLVSLTPAGFGWTLGYEDVPSFQDIHLSKRASVDASGENGGEIQIQGKRVTLTDGSAIFALTLGSQSGGTVTVNASDSVEVIGTSADPLFPSAVFTDTEGAGAGGDLTITTGELLVRDGAVVTSDTYSAGDAGSLTVNANTSVNLSGTSADGRSISGLFTTSQGDGAAGDLTINTLALLVQNGAKVSSATDGKGKGGSLAVNADTLVNLSGTSANGRSSSGLFTTTRGDKAAGDLTITTGHLFVQNGALVRTDTLGAGDAGSLTVNADTLIKLSGTAGRITGLLAQAQRKATGNGGSLTIETGQLLVENGAVVTTATFATLGEGSGGTLEVNASESVELSGTSKDGQSPSLLTALSTGIGNAGDLRIETGKLIVRDGAAVTVSSLGLGKAGSLTVEAGFIELEQGFFQADTRAGGGNIMLRSPTLLMRRQSQITTDAKGTATGGNITLNTDVLAALQNSDIRANAEEGSGGQVIINAQGIFGTEFREVDTTESDITATSQLGPQFSGTVEINTPDINPSLGLFALPEEIVDATRLIAQGCSATEGDVSAGASEFIITGRGGLPPSSREALSSDAIQVNWVTLNPGVHNRSSPAQATGSTSSTPPAIVEAQGWAIGSNGEVILTATAPTVRPHSSWVPRADCGAN